MSWSAANIALAAAAVLSGGQKALNDTEISAWKRIRTSVVPIVQSGAVRASGALIGADGTIIAHRTVLPAPPLFAKMADGRLVPLKEISSDNQTQLVLLQASGWSGGTPVRVMTDGRLQRPLKLMAALPESAIRAELYSTTKMGMLGGSQRLMKLSEVRFEDPQSQVAGALLFSMSGELVGILGATLDNPGSPAMDMEALLNIAQKAAPEGMRAGGGGRREFGPAPMTVAYSVAPDVLQRVVSGFQSPLRQVAHPALGIMVRDAPNGGAFVETVHVQSTAYKGGIRGGDVITEINGEKIGNKLDYSRFLLSQKVGATLDVHVIRNGEVVALKVVVGK